MVQISQSDVVRVRQARWRVSDIRTYEQCQVLTLSGLGPPKDGLERQVIAPFDVVEPVQRATGSTGITRRLWRRAVRALIAADTPPGSLSRARSANIDLLPHQLEPALAVVRGLGSRVLLADDVGLGKTIQAGLIVAELQAKSVADRILVITPAGLRDQWAEELSTRFGIAAAVVDAHAARQMTALLPVGVNPWQTAPVVITSIDYVKRHEILAVVAACRWDVVVVDEAHGVARNNDRHAAISALAARASYVVLLTATPHDGDRRAFASLCSIGSAPNDKLLAFRRGRHNVQVVARRRIHQLQVRLSHDEARMHVLLERFSQEIRAHHAGGEPADNYWIALSVLHKRALSSAQSLHSSIDRRLAAISSPNERRASQLALPLGDPDGELTAADEAPAWSQFLSLRDPVYEERLLRALAKAAAKASRQETKIALLARLLRRVNEPAIVFTEYRDTLMHLQRSLATASVLLHGGMTREERLATVDRFTRGGARLLLATDAAGEGLNLQQTCRLVINLELPWNPMRLAQRIGRVDRIGQRRPVHVFHLIARDSYESAILGRLRARVATARAEVGGTDPLGNDAAIGRLVIGNQTPAVSTIDVEAEAPAVWTPSLAAEADVESRRIATARTLTRHGDNRALARLEGSGPFVTIARCWRTRASLRDRTVELWVAAAEDRSLRRVGSTIAAIEVPAGNRHDEEAVRRLVERATEEWRRRMLAHHHAFTGALLARLQAMPSQVRSNHGRGAEPFQPGLFERREARARLAAVAAQADTEREHRDRIEAAERASAIFLPPQPLFVLKP